MHVLFERRCTMDMKALKVAQKVTLSEALPEGGITGEVIEVNTWHVAVVVAARMEGVEGRYCIEFDYDNNVYRFFDWIPVSQSGWTVDWAVWCPIPDLKIVGLVTEDRPLGFRDVNWGGQEF
jgi:hypothetical protein